MQGNTGSIKLSIAILLLYLAPCKSHEMRIFSMSSGTYISHARLIQELKSYDMIILGETHNNPLHHENQKNVLGELAKTGSVSVGLEFVSWVYQDIFNSYQNGSISENEFLSIIHWGNIPFYYYRPLIETSRDSGGHTYGINAPRWLTNKIAYGGLESLSPADREFLPTDFEIGSELYFKRFKTILEGVGPAMPVEDIKRYFIAQSVWDDSMAEQAIRAGRIFDSRIDLERTSPFVIIVGNFHAEYNLGLPARIEKRGAGQIDLAVIVQVDATSLTEQEIHDVTLPDFDLGNLSDYIIFSFENDSKEQVYISKG